MTEKSNSVAGDPRERRVIAVEDLKVERRDNQPPRLVGHAAVFNSLSENLGGWFERIEPGAFADTVGEDDIRALFNHDSNIILGRIRAKTLTLREDKTGLAFEIIPPDTSAVRDLVLSPIERGDVTGMSFAFRVKPGGQDWAEDDDGRTIRTLKKVRLYEISPVVFPAYPATDVALRDLAAWRRAQAPAGPSNLIKARQRIAEL